MYRLNSVHIVLLEPLMKCGESMEQKLGAEDQCSTAWKLKKCREYCSYRYSLGKSIRARSLERTTEKAISERQTVNGLKLKLF
jgi:hypothetical protein